MIQVYDKSTTDFSKNGRLLDEAISCSVEEELNGAYELELEHPIDSRGKWQELIEGNIIKADGQLFRIYNKRKTLRALNVNARHIFYDLIDNFLDDVRPENLSGIGALEWILARTQYAHSFSCIGDVAGSNTRYFIRKNVVEAIMGSEGIINTWGGEIERDNFVIKYKQARGLDRGVHVRYGKNIIGIEETINLDGVCTRMLPIGKDGLMLPERYIDSPYINNYPHPKIKKYEFDIGVDEENGITEAIAIEQLRTVATVFMADNKIDIPPVNYKVDFIELSKTEEYKNFTVIERVHLGDIVTIKHSKLNIDLKAKAIKIKKNVLTNRIEAIELGNIKNNLASSLNQVVNGLRSLKELQEQEKSAFQQAIDNATQLLTSALGGYVIKRTGELLIMDTEDPATATKVWRWNINGLGYSSKGINGPFETAITMDGWIVGKFVTAHSITVNHLSADVGQSLDISSNKSIISKVTQTDIDNSINAIQVGGRNLAQINLVGKYMSGTTSTGVMTNISQNGYSFTTTGNPVDLIGFIAKNLSGTQLMISGESDLATVIYYYTFRDSNDVVVQSQKNGNVTTQNGKFRFDLVIPNNAERIHIGLGKYPYSIDYTISDVKIEIGNKATDWTPAPEDVQDSIDVAQDNINGVNEDLSTRINSAETEIQQTKDQISMKAEKTVTDELGNVVEQHSTAITTLSDQFNVEITKVTTGLNATKDDLTTVKSYMHFDENGLTLGKSSDPMQLSLANNEVSILDNGAKVMYVNGQKMLISAAEILNSLIVGQHKIEKYDSNITLVRWVGGN